MPRATTAAHEQPAVHFELIPVERLRVHEEIQADLLERIMDQIKEDGYVKRPILVAEDHWVVLDGHHRFAALQALGCRRIPCYVVDYFSEAVDLSLWPTAQVKTVSKEEVVRRAKAGTPYTPKTTRHRIKFHLPDVFTDLEDLM